MGCGALGGHLPQVLVPSVSWQGECFFGRGQGGGRGLRVQAGRVKPSCQQPEEVSFLEWTKLQERSLATGNHPSKGRQEQGATLQAPACDGGDTPQPPHDSKGSPRSSARGVQPGFS